MKPMKFAAKGGGNDDFKRVPAGMHLAVCNLICDVGMQPGSGMYPNPKHQIYVRFEVPAERTTFERDGKTVEGPLTIGRFYTASMSEKANLRKDLESWRSRKFTDEEAADFDISAILGKACMLTVVESTKGDKTYANISSMGPLPKGLPVPKAENPLIYYCGDGDKEARARLPEWLNEKIDGQIVEDVRRCGRDDDHDTIADHVDSGLDDPIPF